MLTLEDRAHAWIAAWNSHDLGRILTLYADNCTMSSPKIAAYGASPDGTLCGKEKLQAYWSNALKKQPSLSFTPDRVFTSPDSIVLLYRDHHGHAVCEYLRYGNDGKIIQAAAHHLAHAAPANG